MKLIMNLVATSYIQLDRHKEVKVPVMCDTLTGNSLGPQKSVEVLLPQNSSVAPVKLPLCHQQPA